MQTPPRQFPFVEIKLKEPGDTENPTSPRTYGRLYEDPASTKAFSKWLDLYSKKNFLSKSIDAGQRLNLSFVNSVCRFLYFPNLTQKEYLNIVAMN